MNFDARRCWFRKRLVNRWRAGSWIMVSGELSGAGGHISTGWRQHRSNGPPQDRHLVDRAKPFKPMESFLHKLLGWVATSLPGRSEKTPMRVAGSCNPISAPVMNDSALYSSPHDRLTPVTQQGGGPRARSFCACPQHASAAAFPLIDLHSFVFLASRNTLAGPIANNGFIAGTIRTRVWGR